MARTKPGADRVTWLHGDATALPPLQVDLATMTANVAQVFVTDEDWAATLSAVHAALRPGGHLVFETRDPAAEAWREWDREHTFTRADVAGGVEAWCELTDVDGDLVSFRWTVVFDSDGAVLTSDSTLRFRSREPRSRRRWRPPASPSWRSATLRTGPVASWSSWPVGAESVLQ